MNWNEQLAWDYKNADSQAINKTIEGFNWAKQFGKKDIKQTRL